MITLVLGGARSGKSAMAERLVAQLPPPVTYVATGVIGDDADLARRVEVHRRRRPATWRTVEAGPDLEGALAAAPGTVMVDSLGMWVAATWDSSSGRLKADLATLCQALESRSGDTVVVSDEVGLGVHPFSEAGRRFRDVLGVVNQAVAERSDRVLLVVAGRALPLDRV